MRRTRQQAIAATALLLTAAICSCASQSPTYQSWGEKINAAPKNNATKEDISLMLGSEPVKCERIPGRPTVGMLLRHSSGTTILDIFPDSPAAGTGIKVGDKILSINSQPVHSMEDVIASTEGMEGPSPSITIETQSGSYIVTPKSTSESEQCSWEVNARRTERMSGNAAQREKAHQRHFRATCRFADGKAYICHWKWQE